jgi:hypothetical protein
VTHQNTERGTRSDAAHYVLHGLSLPRAVLNALHKRGIYCQPGISIEHQNRANRYVLRGVESGGAVSDVGRACAFVSREGSPLPWLQRIDSVGVNGRHAIYLADNFVRLEMLRVGRTCDLIVTLHTLSYSTTGARPSIVSKLIFRECDGTLPVDLWKREHQAQRGNLAPIFYSRGGEAMQLPQTFEAAITKLTACVCCLGCKHSHVGRPPSATGEIS